MAPGERSIPRLPVSLMAEVERVARAQERTVSQVLSEAVDRYLKDERWLKLKAYGRERARSLGFAEADVQRLIAETRQECGLKQ
jgi:metal-responsive CopG/Arc/MetJ family transcriptional regulator